MKKIYFTVGPSKTLPSINKYTKLALKEDIFSLNHRGKEFQELFKDTSYNLKKLLNIPSNYSIFFLSSGTEGMERVIQNCVSKKSLHVINGKFAERFYETAIALGKKAVKFEANQAFFAKDLPELKNLELIAFTQNETSTSMAIPMEEIYKTKYKYKKSLIALDTVSSMPFVNVDYKKIDLVFFSVQKGFGMPSGLGILIVGPRALAKAKLLTKQGVIIGSYHNFLTLLEFANKNQTPETPNVFAIYLFNKIIKEFLKKGIVRIRKETNEKAEMLYKFFESEIMFKPQIINNNFRSKTTLVITVKNGSTDVVKYLLSKGIIVARGYGGQKEMSIRIANFPAHTKKEVKMLINLLKNYARKHILSS